MTGAHKCQPEAAALRQHTPTPWYIIAGDDYYITAEDYPKEFIGRFKGDDNGGYLAVVGNRPADFGEANAAFIVEAVNNHAALQQSCEELGDMVKARDAQLFVAERESAALKSRVEELTKALEEIASENTHWDWTDKDTADMALAKIAVQMRLLAKRALAPSLEDR